MRNVEEWVVLQQGFDMPPSEFLGPFSTEREAALKTKQLNEGNDGHRYYVERKTRSVSLHKHGGRAKYYK